MEFLKNGILNHVHFNTPLVSRILLDNILNFCVVKSSGDFDITPCTAIILFSYSGDNSPIKTGSSYTS